jgi:hypothetical protein
VFSRPSPYHQTASGEFFGVLGCPKKINCKLRKTSHAKQGGKEMKNVLSKSSAIPFTSTFKITLKTHNSGGTL